MRHVKSFIFLIPLVGGIAPSVAFAESSSKDDLAYNWNVEVGPVKINVCGDGDCPKKTTTTTTYG